MMRRPAGSDRRLATVLFTDIVGSTELASRLGDRGWKDLVARHHAIVRAELRRYGGRELDTAGDGFFATFERPAQAIECAAAAMDRLLPLGITIRAAVHMGEVEVMGGKVGGMTVHVGARVLQLAEPGSIVVTGTVRDVAGGSGFAFTDLGVQELKGLPGEWRLFEAERPTQRPAAAAMTATTVPAPAEWPGPSALRRRGALVLGTGAALLAIGVVGAIMLVGSQTPVVAEVDSAVRLDPTSGQLVASVGVGERPTGVAIGGGSVWVLSLSDQTVSVIDPRTNEVSRTPGLPGRPTGIAAGADSVWVTNGFGTAGQAEGAILRLGYQTKRVDEQIPLGDGVRGVAIGDGGVWVTNPLTSTVTRIDEVTRGVAEPVAVGVQPEAIAVGFGQVWVGDVVGRSIWRLHPDTLEATVAVTLSDQPTAIAIGFDRLWVTSTQGNSLSVVDPATGRLVKTVEIGGGPRGVAAGTDDVWVALSAGQLVRVDPATFEDAVVQELPGPGEGIAATEQVVWVSVQR